MKSRSDHAVDRLNQPIVYIDRSNVRRAAARAVMRAVYKDGTVNVPSDEVVVGLIARSQ